MCVGWTARCLVLVMVMMVVSWLIPIDDDTLF